MESCWVPYKVSHLLPKFESLLEQFRDLCHGSASSISGIKGDQAIATTGLFGALEF
jgi:hypothetical protein